MNGGNLQFHYKSRRDERPSRLIMERALGLSPDSYKHQLSNQFAYQRGEQQLQRNSITARKPSQYMKTQQVQMVHHSTARSRLSGNKEYVRNLISQRRDENNQKKQEMMRKVKQLQDKVLPMIQHQRQQPFAPQFGWQNRLEQKILKLEIHVDQMKNELQIQMEKKLIEAEQRWQQKFFQIQSLIQGNFYKSRQNP